MEQLNFPPIKYKKTNQTQTHFVSQIDPVTHFTIMFTKKHVLCWLATTLIINQWSGKIYAILISSIQHSCLYTSKRSQFYTVRTSRVHFLDLPAHSLCDTTANMQWLKLNSTYPLNPILYEILYCLAKPICL